MSDYPKSCITLRTLRVETELTAEDEGDPRGFDISLDDEATGLILLKCLIHTDRDISFFVEQWPAIRSAVDQLAKYAPTHDEVMNGGASRSSDGGLEMALSQASTMIERLNRERSQIKHGLQGLADYLGTQQFQMPDRGSVAEAAVVALRHAFNTAGTILKAMYESEMRSTK